MSVADVCVLMDHDHIGRGTTIVQYGIDARFADPVNLRAPRPEYCFEHLCSFGEAVDYENPLDRPIDTMGAAIVFGRCPNAAPDCGPRDVIVQRPADNEDFDANVYYALVGHGVPSQHRHH